ncbi:Spc7-domain-containing protein [Durotheca rogersii]|uniref:Spc7-domain-containing protein n=1 Tax=Durotheca rogersii TaxID=419775 RepID=UPI00221EF5F2|nr:Spc7-domain-containing protein [Durotheca rogersii]KAI5864704.1 Spc7-domain-containing protein [Durotheca rogersii]
MSSRADSTVPSTRRLRKSTGLSPAKKKTEKENITVDVASSLASNGGRKKSRSKSMGPGGLDALKPGSGNRRMSLAAPARPPPRSILKPTIPLPEIPSYKSKLPTRATTSSSTVQGADMLPNPFQTDDTGSSGTKIAVRTEEEQQAAAREREERERAQLEKEINDRREARRKSLANRRVSFAAEATLHTFHEIEYMQDSTTSTDSTRRASSLAARSPAPQPAGEEASDPPSTPPEQSEDADPDSPENQPDVHQGKSRRSSAASSLNFNSNDETLASSIYSSDSEAADGVIEAHEEIGSDSGSDSDADGVTMDLGVDEVTGMSAVSAISARSTYSSDSSDTVDTALRLASQRAETQRFDEEEEVIPSFGWVKKPPPAQSSYIQGQEDIQSSSNTNPARSGDDREETGAMDMDDDMDMDMEMTHAVGGIIKFNDSPKDLQEEEEMSMDVTRALGGILPAYNKLQKRQSASPEKVGEDLAMEDATMEFTTAVGAIQKGIPTVANLIDFGDNENNEDMSMELTTVMGAVLSGNRAIPKKPLQGRRRTIATGEDEATMDMTVGLGRILPGSENVENDENDEEVTMGMDMTIAMGGIIKGPPSAKDRTEARHLMEEEVDKDDNVPSLRSSSKRRLSEVIAGANAPEAGRSPGLSAFQGQELRRSISLQKPAATIDSSPVRVVPTLNSTSPANLGTPNARGPRTPLKSSPSSKSKPRSASPPKHGSTVSNSTPRSASKNGQTPSIFRQDSATGTSTPRVILTPQNRRLSGVGADKPGLGSPRVTAILDRRGSISDSAESFTPVEAPRVVTFAKPQIIEEEVDRERQEEADREHRFHLGDADEETTTTLKDMISSMTPKKNPLKGRKSLHVGSARGLLGKRPAELEDEDDDSELRDGIKRLRNHQGSPVKNVRLHAPPSKEETTGRVTRSSSKTPEDVGDRGTGVTPMLSPKKASAIATSPQAKAHPGGPEFDRPAITINFDELSVAIEENTHGGNNGDQIHLQDFLNMTNIRFMELTTTKRRHTQAPTVTKGDAALEKEDLSLEKCVVAGACTVPMLELYQHSCRELKKYISEGRRIVREIETETLEENPPLFREYMSATPEYKLFMDNQFKNVKTHARLLSKAMWYEWRMKLQDGLKEGLVKISEGMEADEELLTREQDLLEAVLPGLVEQSVSLETEHESLESWAQELADCDPEELQSARSELTEVDADMQEKTRKIEELREQLKETETKINEATQRKKDCVSDIEEAERIREECRGWSSNEINSLKARVDEIEKKYGWTITGTVGTSPSMTYKREIELVFDVAAFKSLKPNSRIDLRYIAANREANPEPGTPEKEFFVQCIRDHVQGLAQAETKISDLLGTVSASWQKARYVSENIRLVNCTFPTTVVKTSDSSVAVRSTLFLRPLKTKVEIVLGLHGGCGGGPQESRGVEVTITPEARVVYGEQFKADKIVEFLAAEIGTRVVADGERVGSGKVDDWSNAVVKLYEKLLASGKK